MQILERLYQIFRGIRCQVLYANFGFVSHCPHTPSCGTQFVRDAKRNGIWHALRTQSWKALMCF